MTAGFLFALLDYKNLIYPDSSALQLFFF